MNRAALYLSAVLVFSFSTPSAWGGQKKQVQSKHLRTPSITVIHHRAPPAVHSAASVGMHFSRGCAPAATLLLVADRLHLSSADLADALPGALFTAKFPCVRYVSAEIADVGAMLMIAIPVSEEMFDLAILHPSGLTMQFGALHASLSASIHEKWTDIRLPAQDWEQALTSETSLVPPHLVWESAILMREMNKSLNNSRNTWFRLVMEPDAETGSDKIIGLELLDYSSIEKSQVLNAVTWLNRADTAGAYFDESGIDFEKLFWQSPVRFKRLSRGIGKSVTTQKQRVPVKQVKKKKKTSFRTVTIRHHRQHIGVDFAATMGTPVNAVADAQVAFMGWRGAYGNLVVLEHGKNYFTYYAHLSKFAEDLYVGKKLLRGEELGLVGSTGRSTGPHLHFEIRQHDAYIDPLTDGYTLELWSLRADELPALLVTMLRMDLTRDVVIQKNTAASH